MARAATRCGSPFFFLRALSARLAFRIRTCVAVFMGLVGVCECGSGLSQCLGVMGGAWVPRAAASWAGIIILSGACRLRILYFILYKVDKYIQQRTDIGMALGPTLGGAQSGELNQTYLSSPALLWSASKG